MNSKKDNQSELEGIIEKFAKKIDAHLDENKAILIDFAYTSKNVTNKNINKDHHIISFLYSEYGEGVISSYKKILETLSKADSEYTSTTKLDDKVDSKIFPSVKIVADSVVGCKKYKMSNQINNETYVLEHQELVLEDVDKWGETLCEIVDENIGFGNFLTVFGLKADNLSYFLFLFTSEEIKEEKYNEILKFNGLIGMNISRIIKIQKLEELNKEAQKSAKTAIMARNMSHNLGSHVLSYLKEALKDVGNILEQNVLDELHAVLLNSNDLDDFRKVIDEKSIKLPFLVGLGKFISYLQERQDFIATIATDYIPPFSTVNFKDFIFDEINSDLKHLRHTKSEQHINKNILLNYIAKSEEFDREDIKIKFRSYNGLNESIYNRSCLLNWDEEDVLEKDIFDLRTKFDIELPGGMLGRQAIYSILENILRNSCKHNTFEEDRTLELSFDIREFEFSNKLNTIQTERNEEPYYINETIYKSKVQDPKLIKKFDKKNFYLMSITDSNKNEDDELWKKLNEKINSSLIDTNDMSLNQEDKGMKELAISAFWMIGLDYTEEYKPIWYSKSENGGLRLNFFVRKSKRMLVVSDTFIDFEDDRDEIISPKEFEKIDEKELYYRMYVIDKAIINENILTKARNSGCRILVLDDIKKADYLKCYAKWLKKELGELPNVKIDDNTNQYNIGLNESGDLITDNIENMNKILYKAHYETKEQYQQTENIQFVESVTGHNSSNRWIRSATKDKEWYLRSVESAMMNVCIIDERIFDRLIDPKRAKNKKIINLINKISHTKNQEQDKFIDDLFNIISEDESIKIDKLIDENDFDAIKTMYTIPNEENLKSNFLVKKGIYVYNIDYSNREVIDAGNIKVGKIDNKNKITFYNKDLHFKFIFIHQGLLDKLSSEDKEYNKGKGIQKSFDSNVLRTIIHSGRSKPANMLKGFAFTPYSLLSSVIDDTKLSLIDVCMNSQTE